MDIDPNLALAFLALAFTLLLTIIRARTGPIILTATGKARIVVTDRQVLQLRL